MARIWDCDPKWLNRKHLVAEHKELGQLFRDMLKPMIGERGYYHNHYEALRFEADMNLLVARDDFLVREAITRGYTFNQAWISLPETGISLESMREWDITRKTTWPYTPWRWIDFAATHGWPRSYDAQYWAPWKRDCMHMRHYLQLGDRWSAAYKDGNRPFLDPYNVPVIGTPTPTSERLKFVEP